MNPTTTALDYLNQVATANNEAIRKAHFVNYLHRVFDTSEGARAIIDDFAGGAERKVLDIPRAAGKSKTGFADTQYRQVIIEFEHDIKAPAKLRHAEYQLREYFAGNFNSHHTDDFRLLATDGIRWKVYGALPESYLNKTSISPEEVQLKETESFTLSPDSAPAFFAFIDRHLFRLEKQTPTLESILLDWGYVGAVSDGLRAA